MSKDRIRTKKDSYRCFGRIRCLLGGVALAWIAGTTIPVLTMEASSREKKVFAHHMGSLNAGRGAMAWHTRNPELGDPATSYGGDYRTAPLVPYDLPEMTLEESADFQIRQALRIGLNGFAVNAWAGGEEAKQFLDALFKVAEEKDYPFEISLCPDPNTVDQPDGLTQAWADAIKYLLDRHGDSPKLARRDGKPIIFGYQSVFIWVEYLEKKYNYDRELVDEARTTPAGWESIGEAFDQLAALVGQPLYYQFDMSAFYHGVELRLVPEGGLAQAAEAVAQQMPAVCEFLPSRETGEIAQATLAAASEWGQPIFMSYDNPRTPATFGGPGTDALRQLWGDARARNSTLLQLSTWNDFHENTNIAPGTGTNYAYFDLTGYLIEWWKTGEQPQSTRDRIYLFSRKYPRWSHMYPFRDWQGSDGVVEVLTILPAPARINLPGRGAYDAPAGLFHQQFPVNAGEVKVELIRDGEIQAVVESADPISDLPFRHDNGITGSCSEDAHHWGQDFESLPLYRYSEYGDIDGDGLPNWFEMYWFGHFGDLSTALSAKPDEDVNGDGYTNLEAYLAQRSPVAPPGTQPDPAERTPFPGISLSVPGRIEAEYFDLGGLSVAYFDTTAANEGGQFRPAESVGIEGTADVGGGYNVGWMASGEWMKYTVNVETGGLYDLHARVARQDSGDGQLRIFFDGKDVAGAVPIRSTGGWQTWETVVIPNVSLKAGIQTLQIAVATGWFNINYFDVLTAGSDQAPVVNITSPATGAKFHPGGLVEVVAEAAGLDGSIARVEFFADGQKVGEVRDQPYRFATTELGIGIHVLTAKATDVNGIGALSESVEIEVREGNVPFYGSALPFPGRIRAKDYDRGGQNISYSDSTIVNEGGGYRPEDRVDLEATADVGGGYNVGWTAPGEWLLYTVDVAQTGTYDLAVRAATISDSASFRLEFEGIDPVCIVVPNTGGWQNWTTINVPGITLSKGVQTLRLYSDTGDFNVNYIEAETVGVSLPHFYTEWLHLHFSPEEIANPGIMGETADPNGDGVPNLMAYALNQSPWESQCGKLPKPGTVTIDGDVYLTLTYARLAGVQDVVYHVEVSADLTNWLGGAEHVVVVSVAPDGQSEVVVVRDSIPFRLTTHRQMRLRVEYVASSLL